MPPLRLLHTSDWHLGHELHGRDREFEHGAFLDWLVAQAVLFAAHVVVVAGDVFDTSNPSARAQAAYYRFLRTLRAALPEVRIVVVGGNHDSGHRLDAPSPLLDELGVHVVGVVPRRADGSLDVDRVLVPLRGDGGAVAAWLVAMPYVRLQDLPVAALASPAAASAAIAALYEEALAAADDRAGADAAVVATGHSFFAHAVSSVDSERKIQMGNEAALPAELFVDAVQYLALGHLHRAQRVGGHEHLRYCGSPLPLALDERTYDHQVLAVTLQGRTPAVVEPRRVPRRVEVVRIPEAGTARLVEVLWRLAQLPARGAGPAHARPYLDIAVREDVRVPDLRGQLDAALDDRDAWLARLVDHSPRLMGGDPGISAASLAEADPEHIFAEFWGLHEPEPPAAAVRAAFHELLESVRAERVRG